MEKGLKTGMYYLRTRPKADAIQFTVDQTELAATKKADEVSSRNDKENNPNRAIQGLDYQEEPECANCSA